MIYSDGDKQYFARLVDALEPWIGQVVFVGGWASRLYRFHPLALKLSHEPLATLDADVALPERLAPRQEDIATRLKEREFEAELVGEATPPVTYYRLSGDNNFFAEFLSPLRGSRIKRDGVRDVTTVIAGVSTQKLRYIDLLLEEPWLVTLKAEDGFIPLDAATIRVPNPVAFLVQKALIHDERDPQDRAKDLLYMHDTFEVFADELENFSKMWHQNVRPLLPPKAQERVESLPRWLFGSVTDDIRQAARIDGARALTPAVIKETCHFVWGQILSERTTDSTDSAQ